MGREVDDRVVQMQFDNAQFERETKRSLNTIERLKASLNFDKAGESLSGLTTTASKLDLTPVSDGVDTISMRFKALDVVAATVISNITSRAVGLGKALVSAFTIDPVKSGLQEYETQINSVQTILANTQSKGTTIDQVNAALDELNHYADMTIYNFTEMTKNIGTFTAAGVDLDTSVQAIKGIANLAAVSGSTSQQASTAMYQLSQALAAGKVTLMDWNSVVNAGMGGQVFQDALLETARVDGVAIDQMIAKHGSFRETLQEGWLTSEVLLDTLAKFTGDLNEEQLLSKGYTEDQAKAILELGTTANDAATKVKTFTQLIDTLKEAVQSGWTQSWEYIFGDFEQAKEFWTEISDVISNVVNESANARNELLKGAMTSGWSQFLDTGITDSATVMEQVLTDIGKQMGVVSDETIEAAGGFEKSLQSGWLTADMLQKGINEVVDQAQSLLTMSDEQLAADGLSRDSIKETLDIYTKLNEEIARGNVSLQTFSDRMGKSSGRDNLVQSVRNIMSAVGTMVSSIKGAFDDIFPPTTVDQLYSITEGIERFTRGLILSEENADKVQRVFKGVFSVFKIGTDILDTIYKGFLNIVKTMSPVGNSLLDLAASIGDFLVGVQQAVDSSGVFQGILSGLEWVCNAASKGIDKFTGSIESLSQKTTIVLDPIQAISNALTSFVNFVAPGLEWFGTTASEALGEFSKSAYEAFNNFDPTNLYNFMNAGMGLGILNAIRNFIGSGKSILDGASGMIDGVKKMITSLGDAINAWKTNKNAETLMTVAKAIGVLAASLTVLSFIKPERLAGSLLSITVLFTELVAALEVLNTLTLGKKFQVATLSAAMVAMSTGILILSAALKTISSVQPDRLVTSVLALGVVLAELSVATTFLSSTATRMTKGTTGMVLMATAVRILVSSVSALGSMSLDSLTKGIVSLGVVMTELGAFAVLVNKFGGSIGLLNGVSFNLLASSLLILQKAVSSFGAMDLGDIAKGLGAVGVALAEFAGFGFLSKFSKNLISGSVAVTIMSAAMNLLVDPMKELGALDLETLAKALGAMAIALTEFVVALNLMNGGLASSASILVMAAAMNVLADAFARMDELSIGSLAKSLISIAVALGIFGVAATLLAPVTPIIVALSLSLGAFAAALGLLLMAASTAGFVDNLAASLSTLSSISFSAFLQSIKDLAWMFVEFIQGIVKGVGEIAATLVTSIAQIITAVCEAIAQAAPAIGDAITALILTLCEVIRNTAPEIASTVVYLIAQVWEAIKGALGDLWNNLTSWFDENIWHHDWFGIGAMFNDFKAIWAGDAEAAGEETAEGYANGLDNKKQSIWDKMSEIASKAAMTWNRFWGIESPSKLAAEDAEYIAEGYSNGLQNGSDVVTNAILNLAQEADNAFRDYWGIHSPSALAASEAENIAIGMQLGMANSAEATKQVATYLATHTAEGLYTSDVSKSAYAAGITLGIDYEQGVKDFIGGSELLNWLKGKTGIGEDTSTDTPRTTTPTVNSSSGGSTKKTVAETIEDKYKDQLEANKTLQEIAESEYQLWLTENQNSVSADELLARKMEYTAKEIENQTARVQLAQQKYDEMVSKVGVDKQETKEAYADLLSEQTTLAELRAKQYANLYEDQINRLEIQNDRADKEYQLWVNQNNQASASEKTAKKIEYQTTQLTAATKELELAQQQYDKLREEYGESDLRTQEAYNELLDKQIEEQEKTNELWQARLAQFDDALNAIEMQASIYSQRTSMLSQIYDDGDLSSRSTDYINAVKTYGENSDEARKAQYQGSASAVLGVSVALRNMSDQLAKTNVYQKYYNSLLESGTASAEDLNAAEQQLLSSQSAFIGYASNLADAFNMSDEGKAVTLRLAYAISDNWDTIYGAFKDIWGKIEERSPELTKNLEKTLGTLLSEDTASVATGVVSTVTSALSGDYGGALASGLNTVLSFLGTGMGQSLLDGLGTVLANGLPDIGGMISSFVGSSGLLSSLGAGLEGIVSTIAGGGGLSAAFGGLGTAITSVAAAIPELLPIIAIVAAIGGAIALLIANWDDIGEFFNNLWEQVKEIGSNLINGIVEGIKSAWKGFTDFIGGLFGGVIDFVKGIFGIHSQSTVFFDMGSYIDEGFANGLAKGSDTVNQSISDMTNGALDTATEVSKILYDRLSNSEDFSPKITPVVDLSDTEDSTNWFKSASVGFTNPFQGTPSVSERLAYDVRVRDKNQNGKTDTDSSRADVVAAVDSLGNRLAMMSDSISNMRVVLDSKKLVGGIAGEMDSVLGVRAVRARRGG